MIRLPNNISLTSLSRGFTRPRAALIPQNAPSSASLIAQRHVSNIFSPCATYARCFGTAFRPAWGTNAMAQNRTTAASGSNSFLAKSSGLQPITPPISNVSGANAIQTRGVTNRMRKRYQVKKFHFIKKIKKVRYRTFFLTCHVKFKHFFISIFFET